jgi:hypothetical protein
LAKALNGRAASGTSRGAADHCGFAQRDHAGGDPVPLSQSPSGKKLSRLNRV